ncbi:hypothetical protein GGR32_002266 [Mesonia hippocampi]|uniref:DUF937 domain-containing protein n=1 Tax=Mesonia hippocampi TaxID=1628250 RepID=A0A840F116_9FLAO|nr:DUF937 domain-containing protein [Mesonia hippocampi]MBB4119954.1 hypothetical protein [Mesonia hippocampi]
MASILDLLKTDVGEQLIQGATTETGETKDNIVSVLSMALPTMLGAMNKNIQTEEGAKKLNHALEDTRHDGSILSQLGGIVGGGSVDNSLLSDGAGILSHLLGGKQTNVENSISKTTGVSMSSVTKIIQMAAPVLMGFLGNAKRKDGVSQSGLTDLIGAAMGESSSNMSIIESLLDADNDGSVIDDVAGKLLGDKAGGLLGGLFGK